MDIEDLSYRDAAKVLQEEGHKVNSGNVWYSTVASMKCVACPCPKRPYNNGRPRKSR